MTQNIRPVSPDEVSAHDTEFFTASWQNLCQQVVTLDEAWWHREDIDQKYPTIQIYGLLNDFILNHFPAIGQLILPLPKGISTAICLDFESVGWLVFTAKPANPNSPRGHMNYPYFILKIPA